MYGYKNGLRMNKLCITNAKDSEETLIMVIKGGSLEPGTRLAALKLPMSPTPVLYRSSKTLELKYYN